MLHPKQDFEVIKTSPSFIQYKIRNELIFLLGQFRYFAQQLYLDFKWDFYRCQFLYDNVSHMYILMVFENDESYNKQIIS